MEDLDTLAGTRPVFRGLRRVATSTQDGDASVAACRDETRFQGIATSTGLGLTSALRTTCRDETRFQGIATGRPRGRRRQRQECRDLQGRDPFSGDCDLNSYASSTSAASSSTCRDETRFQGIASGGCTATTRPATHPVLQGRDPFSGDCDLDDGTGGGDGGVEVLQGRDPFSGDCDAILGGALGPPSAGPACRDETRFQGIATRASRIRRASESTSEGLQGRDPFSGDCDGGCGAVLPGTPTCRDLQGRDPFSGDCDGLSLCPTWRNSENHLQGRDPFSGDGDGEKGRAMKPTG